MMDIVTSCCTKSALLLLSTSMAISAQPIGTYHYKGNSEPTFSSFDDILTFSVNDSKRASAIASQQSENMKNTIIILIDNYNRTEEKGQETSSLDPYALSWYISSFGALVVFFLAVSLTECLCAKRVTTSTATSATLCESLPSICVEEPPPPPYHLFGPPAYDTLFYGVREDKKKCDVFTIEVHQANVRRDS